MESDELAAMETPCIELGVGALEEPGLDTAAALFFPSAAAIRKRGGDGK